MTYFAADYVYKDGQLLPEHYVLVEQGVIQEVAPLRQLHPRAFRDMVAFEDALLMPGLLNAHTHSYQSLMRGWRNVQQAAASVLNLSYVTSAAKYAFCQLLRQGVTSVCDMLDVPDPELRFAKAIMQAADEVGIRLVLAKAPDGLEGEGAMAHWLEQLDALRRLAAQYNRVAVMPGLTEMPSEPLVWLARAADWAQTHDTLFHYHLSPTAQERETFLTQKGQPVVQYLAAHQALSPRGVGIHATWLDDGELQALGTSGQGLVFTPSTTLAHGQPCPRVKDAMDAGVTVALGTGSWIRNNRGSVLDEIRLVTVVQHSIFQKEYLYSAQRALTLVTENAGKLLGLPVGQLAQHQLADFVVLDLNDWSLQPHSKLLHHMAYSIASSAINAVYVGGERVVDTGELLTVNESAILQQVTRTVDNMALVSRPLEPDDNEDEVLV